MLSFEELKYRLTTEDDLGGRWLNVYLDVKRNYWLQGYGGMGTSQYSQLEKDHPFVRYIKQLQEEGLLLEDEFQYHYEVGVELAQLSPIERTQQFKHLTSKESKDASDMLFKAFDKKQDD